MKVEIVPYQPAHLRAMALQPKQEFIGAWVNSDYPEALAAAPGISYSAVRGDEVLACAGLAEQWTGRMLAWALLARGIGGGFVVIDRAVKRCLEAAPARRIEAHVDAEFLPAQRWVERLGFNREGLMRAFSVDGRDFQLWARVR
ncbi:MAG: GNAT family N-acetyltransferase [Burkholderiales bacterium]|nr:GNAT family N-acetyltransferase [Burkholderiales bacterium]